MKTLLLGSIAALCLCGCSSNKPQVKAIHERPWIGGAFEMAPTPKIARDQKFKKNGALIAHAAPETPLGKAGVREGDLILAVNGKKVGSDWHAKKAFAKATSAPFPITIYRAGEITDVTVTPGVERYQDANNLMVALGFKSNFDIDLYPNPDFSLIALGYESEPQRLDLHSAKGKYLSDVQQREGQPAPDAYWQGLRSDEGWKMWLGPISLSRNKMIVSQKAAQ